MINLVYTAQLGASGTLTALSVKGHDINSMQVHTLCTDLIRQRRDKHALKHAYRFDNMDCWNGGDWLIVKGGLEDTSFHGGPRA